MKDARTIAHARKIAHGGGTAPGEIGEDLEREVMEALGALPGVTLYRNDVREVINARTGGRVMTGLGGKGAPDLHVEIRTRHGLTVCVWMECKNGRRAALTEGQRGWHEAAAREGRHVYVVRSPEHALAIVESFRRGVVHA